MPSRRLNGIVHAATRPAHSDVVAYHAGLREQVLERRINVVRPLGTHLRNRFGRKLVEPLSLTIPIAAVIERQNINSCRGELAGKVIPNSALPIALVQQENARSWFLSGKVGCLELQAIGSREIDYALHARRRRCEMTKSRKKGMRRQTNKRS